MYPQIFEDICEFLTFSASSVEPEAGIPGFRCVLREPPAAVPPEQQAAPSTSAFVCLV